MPNVDIKISSKVFNKAYLPYLDDESRYLVFFGGAGSGKSHFIAQRYVYKLLNNKLCNLLVVRNVGDTNRDSTFSLFKQVISKWKLTQYFSIRESDMRIKCKINGNIIIFKGLDDSEKLKSITFEKGELTDIWMEEASEDNEADFNQLDVRLRGVGTKKQIVVSFNPVDIKHWLKKRFFDNRVHNAKVLKTTYKDNRFLDDDYIRLLESYKDTDPYYYDVYCCGNWGVLGKTIFDKHKVAERLRVLRERKPLKAGYFKYDYDGLKITNIKWVDDDGSDMCIQIYVDRKPFTPYVVGADTSGDGSDYFIGQAIDNTNGAQVATLRHQFDEDLFTKQYYCLGQYYNWALLGPETNFSTYPMNELQRLNYPNLYVREVEDSITNKLEKRFGFKTTTLTRPIILADLVRIAREHIEFFNDITTLEEMLTFARNEKGKPCAISGAHDDCVIAMAITYYIRTQQSFNVLEEAQQEQKKWIDTVKPKKKQGLI